MSNLMPNTTTVTQLQRNYKKVAQRAKALREPLIILSNNTPEGVYLDYETFKEKFSKQKSSKRNIDQIFGVWTEKEAEEFNATIEEAFEKVDYEKW